MVLSRDLDAVPCTLRWSIVICGQVNKSEQGLPYCCSTFLFIPPVSSPALCLPFASLPLTELKPPLKLASLTAGAASSVQLEVLCLWGVQTQASYALLQPAQKAVLDGSVAIGTRKVCSVKCKIVHVWSSWSVMDLPEHSCLLHRNLNTTVPSTPQVLLTSEPSETIYMVSISPQLYIMNEQDVTN